MRLERKKLPRHAITKNTQKTLSNLHVCAALTPSCWQLEAAILPPVGVAEVTEAAVLMGGAPLVPTSGTGCQATLAALLTVFSLRHLLRILRDGFGYDPRRGCLPWREGGKSEEGGEENGESGGRGKE